MPEGKSLNIKIAPANDELLIEMPQVPLFSRSFFAMGTRCEVVLINTGEEFGERVIALLKKEVSQLESLMSRFIPGSAIELLNQQKPEKWLDVPAALWEILISCRDFYEKSGGVFDVTTAQLIKLWKNTSCYVPSAKEIEDARSLSGFDKLEFDTGNKRIQKRVEGLEFDLGAIGKGITLDKIRRQLTDLGMKHAFVSFGESSVLAMGAHPAGTYWPVGIPNALNPKEILHVFEVNDQVVTTSGTIINSSFQDASVRRHIINPLTGYPVEGMKTVTIRSSSATLGEFLSTTLLILQDVEKKLLLSKIKNAEILSVIYKSDCDLEKELITL